ncbi:MAG: DEAD/DEAH box helicase [Acidimicrobiales bacterium]|nr:DEAD/DEAH box helicase [Acidimicrobiales bacterium]
MDFGPRTEATFLPGDVGRAGTVALWTPEPDDEQATAADTVIIVFPDGPRDTPATLAPIGDLIGPLASLPAATEVRPSVRALSVATRLSLDLISRGRLLPASSPGGADSWCVGPLDSADRTRLGQLVEALPPEVHATPVEGHPGRMASPQSAAGAVLNAVADAFVRTASAPAMAGFDAFAGHDTVDVNAVESWLRSVVAGTGSDTLAGLRIELPDGVDEAVRCILQVGSRVDPSLVMDAADLWAASSAVVGRFGTDVETDLLLTLRRASRVWAPAERLLQESTPEELALDDDEVEELFGPVAEDLAAAGLPVLWPAEVFRPVELRPVVGTPQPEGGSTGRLDLSSLGEIRWHATVDGTDLTESELLELAQAKRPMVRLRGKWVRADPGRLERLNERREVPVGEVVASTLTGEVTVEDETVEAELTGPLVDLAERLRAIDQTRAREAPPALDAELRPYQERGLAWLAEMADLGLGGVLADDMGLGKTIQVLALHLLRHDLDPDHAGPLLVVCPATLLGNWEREAARFIPDVPVRRYHGQSRTLEALASNEIVVATYGIVRRDADELARVGWDLVVADEAQAIKNPMSRTAKAIRTVEAGARFALTGTPVENRLTDLWALLDFTTPGLLGPLDPFQRYLATPIEREQDEEATARLSATVAPFLLRRRKSDPEISPDLPPKTETDRFVGLTTEQATLYKAVVDELLDDVEEAEGINRRGIVLKLLTALKQICNHPAHYLDQPGPLPGRSGKLDAASELLSVIADEGDSALVFTQYVAMGRLLEAHLDANGIPSQFLHGSVPVTQREQMVEWFQAGDPQVFVISLKAGGTGLNLTRATHVIHYDRWWNPAVEDQASDRAWRIGQERPVQIHRMVCEGTLEERIAALLESKRDLAESVIGGGEAWISELSDDELADLVSLGDDR